MDASNAPQIIEHQSKSVNFTPFCTRWVPCSARFVALGINPKGTGALQVYQLEKGELKLKAEAEKKAGFKCGTFGASAFEKRHLATGDYDGKLNIWDLEKLDKPVYSVDAHSKIINCIDGCGGLNIGYGAPEIVTGSMDGCVRVWDPRTQDAVTSLEPADGAKPRDCWAVAFGNSYSDEERCVCAGYDNGDIKLLDLRMNKLRWETNVKNGVTSLEFDRKDIEMNKLIISMLESRMSVVDMRTYHPEEGFAMVSHKAHKSTVWFGRPLPQNRDIFMTGGGKGDVHLYKYNYPQQRVVKDTEGRSKGVAGTLELLNKKSLSEQPLVSFDWSADKQGLAVLAALDHSLKVVVVTRLGQL